MAISSPNRQRPEIITLMGKQSEEFLNFLAVEKGASANTIAAYRNDLRQLADFLGSRGEEGWDVMDRPGLKVSSWIPRGRGSRRHRAPPRWPPVPPSSPFLSAEAP